MNNSIQANKNLGKNFAKVCIHTKHVYTLIDTPKREEAYIKMTQHLAICSICNDEFQKFQSKTMAAQVYIPKALMDRDLRQSFEREVSELFKLMNLNNREILKRKVKKGVHFIDSMGLDFLRNLVSKTMFKTYFFALVIFICLKLFL